MKNTIFIIIIICVSLFLYCTKDKSIFTSCITDAEFIIDSFDINAEQKRHPQTDSLWCQINTNIQYHFVKDMGHLSRVIFQVENHSWSMFSLDGPLRPPDIIYTFDQDFWIKDLSDQEDSLNCKYYFEGLIGDNPKCMREFNDSLNVTIPINRTEH